VSAADRAIDGTVSTYRNGGELLLSTTLGGETGKVAREGTKEYARMIERSHETVALALANLMKKRGITQAELCRATGLDHGTISRYLSGRRGTNLDSRGAKALGKVALVLGVDAEYFCEYRAFRIRAITVADPGLMDDFYDLIVETARLRGLLEETPDDAKE
jgi:transcriptional regulator with XRE-family HTH domain